MHLRTQEKSPRPTEIAIDEASEESFLSPSASSQRTSNIEIGATRAEHLSDHEAQDFCARYLEMPQQSLPATVSLEQFCDSVQFEYSGKLFKPLIDAQVAESAINGGKS